MAGSGPACSAPSPPRLLPRRAVLATRYADAAPTELAEQLQLGALEMRVWEVGGQAAGAEGWCAVL